MASRGERQLPDSECLVPRGIGEKDFSARVSVYPNPSRGSVHVSVPDVENAYVGMYDFQGTGFIAAHG